VGRFSSHDGGGIHPDSVTLTKVHCNCLWHEFCGYILITNFRQYIQEFADRTKGDFHEGNFRIVNARDINCTMIDFGIGSPQAALLVNCLAYLDNLNDSWGDVERKLACEW
jgi:hypothetical protein